MPTELNAQVERCLSFRDHCTLATTEAKVRGKNVIQRNSLKALSFRMQDDEAALHAFASGSSQTFASFAAEFPLLPAPPAPLTDELELPRGTSGGRLSCVVARLRSRAAAACPPTRTRLG